MDSRVTRREFIQAGSLAALAAVTGGVVQCAGGNGNENNSEGTQITVDTSLPQNAALNEVNGALKMTVEGLSRPIMLIRQSQSGFIALSTRCTHQGCEVGLLQQGSITCPCHFSTFDQDGNVTRGPATSPLARYTVTFSEPVLTITL